MYYAQGISKIAESVHATHFGREGHTYLSIKRGVSGGGRWMSDWVELLVPVGNEVAGGALGIMASWLVVTAVRSASCLASPGLSSLL